MLTAPASASRPSRTGSQVAFVPSGPNLARLAEALGTTVDELDGTAGDTTPREGQLDRIERLLIENNEMLSRIVDQLSGDGAADSRQN